MSIETHKATLGATELTIEYGRYAEQADAAITLQAGGTVLLATVVVSKSERDGIDYFPLMVDYEERLYAAGKISGSRFIKREGRPSETAVLTSRLIDRPLRPLFDKNSRKDVQVIITVLSIDKENDPDTLAIIAASCALMKAGTTAFAGPVGAARVGLIDGKLVVNPTRSQMEKSDLDLVVAGTKDRVMMVEAGANEVPENIVLEALKMAQEGMQDVIKIQHSFAKKYVAPEVLVIKEGPTTDEAVKGFAGDAIGEAMGTKDLAKRAEILADWQVKACAHLEGTFKQSEIKNAFNKLTEKYIRSACLEREERPDGRSITEIRPITVEVGVLPRTHGSGLFTRGQTQALTIATLGSPGDEQTIETMDHEGTKRFMHHYNFPPYSTGETSPVRGASRREIGHGALAERALVPVLPSKADFPYTIRLVSEILSSNGSSSMASTCGSTLALMDAGVPIKKPVAGIAMGLMTNPDASEFKVLSDLQGLEDFAGDMDFKIAGTKDGITAIQMDTKIAGLTWPIVEQTLTQAHTGRLFILDKMLAVMPEVRPEMSEFAPRIQTVKIDPSRIGELIGPGGKNINGLIDRAGGKEITTIDIEEDGTVLVSSQDPEMSKLVLEEISFMTRTVTPGELYEGEVVQIIKDKMNPRKEIGAVVELWPGKTGMVHISEVANERIELVSDVLKIGDIVNVKVMTVDPEKNRVGLSIKALLNENK
jgi:polyribonucleotide nucleotidyltransferase